MSFYEHDGDIRGRIILICLGFAAVLGCLPYLVAYVLIPLVLGLGLGFLYHKGCGGRWFGNVALYMPVVSALVLIGLHTLEPAPVPQGITTRMLKMSVQRIDDWKDAFNDFYHFWYGNFPIVNGS
jgi:hypothetical protein